MTHSEGVDVGVLDISHTVEPTAHVDEEIEAQARDVRKKPSHLTIEVHNPEEKRELQPWDLVEPPTEEEKYATTSTAVGKHTLIPKSSYYFGPPPSTSGYGTAPVGHIGVHHPREILRVERDYTGGEVIQFAPIYPLELEGRITPTQFLESINDINEILIEAHSVRYAFVDNLLSVVTLQITSVLGVKTHYEKEMDKLRIMFDDLNASLYNPAGLNLLWPRDVAFLYMEIEYY